MSACILGMTTLNEGSIWISYFGLFLEDIQRQM